MATQPNPVDTTVNQTPATPAASPVSAFDANAEVRRAAVLAAFDKVADEIKSVEKDAAGFRATKGYKVAVTNARKYGLSLDDLAAWSPFAANKDASGVELAVRQLSDRAIPDGGHQYIRDLVKMQRLCVDAADAQIHTAAQEICGSVVERRVFKSNKKTTAKDALTSDTQARELFDAEIANKDDATKAQWEKCRTEPKALAQVALDLNKAQQENGRWRNSLFLPFIHDQLVSHVANEQNTQTGTDPDIDRSSIGKLWVPASASAYKATTACVDKHLNDHPGELVPVDTIKTAISAAVAKAIDTVKTKETAPPPSIEKVRTDLIAKLARTLDKLHNPEINLLNDAAYLEIKSLCDKHGLWPAPKGNGKTEENAQALTDQQARETAAKARTEQTKAEASEADEQTRQENAAAAQAAIDATTDVPPVELTENDKLKELKARRNKLKADAS